MRNLIIITLLGFLTPFSVFGAENLWEYYGGDLPPIEERALIYGGDYEGTEEQNEELLEQLQAGAVFGAPVANIQRSLIPEADNEYYISTTSPSNLRYKALYLATSTPGCAEFSSNGEVFSVGLDCGSGGDATATWHIVNNLLTPTTTIPLQFPARVYASNTIIHSSTTGAFAVGTSDPSHALTITGGDGSSIGKGIRIADFTLTQRDSSSVHALFRTQIDTNNPTNSVLSVAPFKNGKRSSFEFFGTDIVEDGDNWERLQFVAKENTENKIISNAAGTGTAQNIVFQVDGNQFHPADNQFTLAANNLVGFATNSPWAHISIDRATTSNNLPWFTLWAQGSDTPRFIVTDHIDGGRVGIGTSSPYKALSVSGDIVTGTYYASRTDATSTFEGGIRGQQGLRIDDLISCNTLDTDINGNISCGTDAGEFGSNWQFIGTDAIQPTTTVGTLVHASSSFAALLNAQIY